MKDDGKDEKVQVRCEMRTVQKKTIAVWAWKYTEQYDEQWVWLPRSQVTWRYADENVRRNCVVEMPLWLAEDRGIR